MRKLGMTEQQKQHEAASDGKRGDWAKNLVAPLTDLSAPAGKVLDRLIGPAADGIVSVTSQVYAGLLGHRLQQWSNRNLITVTEKSARFFEEKGLDLSQLKMLPDGELYALFDGASRADDDGIQDMWAALLISASTGDVVAHRSKQIARTLDGLLPTDAIVMKFIGLGQYQAYELSALVRKINDLRENGSDEKPGRAHRLWPSEGKLPPTEEDLSRLVAEQETKAVKIETELRTLHETLFQDVDYVHESVENLLRLRLICEKEIEISGEGISVDLSGKVETFEEYPSIYGVEPNELIEVFALVRRELSILSGNLQDEEKPAIFRHNRTNAIPYRFTDFGSELYEACTP